MERMQVDSTNILEIGYDERFASMEVMFRDGKVYQYFDVPQNVYDELKVAASVGQYFNSNIRGVYRYARV